MADERHKHCDSDPIECWVEATQGEYAERGRKIELLTEALKGSEHARLLTEQRLAAASKGDGP